ncbi:hypothetical protein CEXT_190521 [Caerostris extrusa]|uniref:Uncharacterized protein n=1 Tax=Caerostris extrusa TaxID=172846 RepID=A0AAV4MHG5_CAEEX|nr:hypothetical protein CEXT_190521 [Caerostris extrusa]
MPVNYSVIKTILPPPDTPQLSQAILLNIPEAAGHQPMTFPTPRGAGGIIDFVVRENALDTTPDIIRVEKFVYFFH